MIALEITGIYTSRKYYGLIVFNSFIMFYYIQQNFPKKIREVLWPIHKSELRLFVPMGLMMLCMLFNFGALRSVKDSLVVPNIGPEVISFLKLWVVLPSTILFTIIYVRLSNLFSYEQVFYIIVSSFIVFFIFFAYVIFPQQDLLHPDALRVDSWQANYPNLKWFIKIIAKWSYAVMYVFCELWSVVVINLLFWQFANHIFDTQTAKRFYPFLGVIGNFGLIIAGNVLVTFSDLSGISDSVINSGNIDLNMQCEMVLQPIMNSIIFAGILAMVLYTYLNSYVLKMYPLKEKSDLDKTKTTLSFSESIKLLVRSKYIGHIALLVLCYGFVINMLEGPWKAKVRDLYPNTVDYLNFMGKFNIWMGVSCVLFMFVGSNILRRFSWKGAAVVTPYMIAVTGIIFFGFVIISHYMRDIFGWLDPVYFAVIIGAVQNILSKSTKYSLFDSTKEMAYIPLSLELRTKGKATVEVMGLKFGKSLGAFLQSSMFILFPAASFDSLSVYLLVMLVFIISLWIWNVNELHKEYSKLQHD